MSRDPSVHSDDEEVGEEAPMDSNMTLEEREKKWGFTLDELRAATKVVTRLFHDPSLFVNDQHLEDSRLYTMITRDRSKKRLFADVYKTILKQEKSRRKRYLRREDEEAVRNTRMKREREQALNALMASDSAPLLLCDNKTTLEEADQPREVNDDEQEDSLTDVEKQFLRLTGGFESLLRLNRVYSGEGLNVTESAIRCCTANATAETVPDQKGNDNKESSFSSPLDYTVVTSLCAHFYRYIPHCFGTSMPPPIFPNTAGQHCLTADQLKYEATIDAWLVRIARKVGEMASHNSTHSAPRRKLEPNEPHTTYRELLSGEEDFIVRDAAPSKWLHEETLRESLAALLEHKPSALLDEAILNSSVVKTEDVLRAAEVVLLEGGEDERFTPIGRNKGTISSCGIARQALILHIARRLYSSTIVTKAGLSPLDLTYIAPLSTSCEPEEYCMYDDVQLYADEHYEKNSLVLSKFRACNVCRVRYNHLHPYYYSLCHLCGEYNYNKRLMGRDLRGKVVLLTGCRIKIGYAMCISLLRCGAVVLGTTRFAHEAVARFNQEPDYAAWKDRLHLFSLDLRDLWMVTQFCGFLKLKFPKIFAIINNAAQTIRRTPEYTEKLRGIEMSPPPLLKNLIEEDDHAKEWHGFFRHHSAVMVGQPLTIESGVHQEPFQLPPEQEEEGQQPSSSTVVVSTTSQPSAPSHGVVAFDRYDTLAEESDWRATNSWVMNLAEVDGGEATEVMTINALSPFIFNSRLKPCLTNRTGDTCENEARFIINVSAMEGMFYRYKQTTHPHTNMAKAALNMMTRTSGEDYARDGIFMNSVDTGWITDESPKEKKERRAEQQMLCPLDEVDAAARCLDLIYTNSTVYGKFYKDFKEICW